MKSNIIKLTSIFFAALLPSLAFSQEALKSIEEEYYDFLSLQGITKRPTLGYRTLSDNVWKIDNDDNDGNIVESVHTWQNLNLGKMRTLWENETPSDNFFLKGLKQGIYLKIYGPEWFNSFNTHSPYGQNDGALWQGKGYNTSLTGGARLEGYGFEITVKPQVTFSQNLEFEYLPGVYGDTHSYFWKGNIDLVQRYGDEPYWQFDFGDTEARYSWHNFTIGFGFQSPWLGPAWLNPMLGSNNSGTFPKFDIGLRKQEIIIPKLGWYVGDIEGRVWLGQLSESKYFDNNSTNNKRQLTGFNASFTPSFFPWLTIGSTKICFNNWNDFSLKYLNPFYDSNNQEDQKMSIYVDILFPSVGFEVYGEFGKDDYSREKKANPFHTAIYTLGAKKSFSISKKHNIHAELVFEWNNFEASQDFQMQWSYMGYYAHGLISQGYTQNGQIIGAGSGYFGNSQYLGLNVYFPKGKVNFFFHRHCPDNNYIYEMTVGKSIDHNSQIYVDRWSYFKTYHAFGGEALYFVTNSFSVNVGFTGMWIYFPEYSNANKGDPNLRFTAGVKYTL